MKNRFTARDLGSTQFEDRERGPEAEERHRRYVQNAYATLSATPELVFRGAQAGLQVGAALLAVETALLLAIIIAAYSVNEAGSGALYGKTPLVGTFLEPLWPVMLSLPAIPVFGVIGAGAALLRRLGSKRRRVLNNYFNRVAPRFDFMLFWVSILLLLIIGAWVWGLFIPGLDPTGVLFMILFVSAILSWPCHWLWVTLYLPLIQKHGSASMDDIRAIIERQL